MNDFIRPRDNATDFFYDIGILIGTIYQKIVMSNSEIIVDCGELEAETVLRALWNGSFPAAYYNMSGMTPPELDETELKNSVDGRVDYLSGRVIKIDFGRYPKIDVRLYDRDVGEGAAQKIVDSLKK